MFKAHDGRSYRLSPEIRESLTRALGCEEDRLPSFQEARRRLGALLEPRDDPWASHSEDEKAQIDALTTITNLHRASLFLKGRPIEEVFGASATLCQVHGQFVTLPCGCTLSEIFDHHKRGQDGNAVHAHYPKASCDAHRHLTGDFAAHAKAAKAAG